MLKDKTSNQGRKLIVKIKGEPYRFPSRRTFNETVRVLINNVRLYLNNESAQSLYVAYDPVFGDIVWSYDKNFYSRCVLVFDVGEHFKEDYWKWFTLSDSRIRFEFTKALASIVDEDHGSVMEYYSYRKGVGNRGN